MSLESGTEIDIRKALSSEKNNLVKKGKNNNKQRM